MMLSDVCMYVAYIGPKSRTQRPSMCMHIKQSDMRMCMLLGTEVAHVTSDSDTTFKVKEQGHRGLGHIVAASRTACYSEG